MSEIKKIVHSKKNLEEVSTTVYLLARKHFGVELDASFTPKLLTIVEDTLTKFGKKPQKVSAETHIKNLNKLIIDDSLKTIKSMANLQPQQQQPQQQLQQQPQMQPNMNGMQNTMFQNQTLNNGQQLNQHLLQRQQLGQNNLGYNPNPLGGNSLPNPELNPQNFTLNVSTGTFGSGGGGGGNGQSQFGNQQSLPFQGGGANLFGNQQPFQNSGGGANLFGNMGQQQDLGSLVDNLAYQRGYNITQNQVAPPRVDFTLPTTQHGTDPNFVMQKLQQEQLAQQALQNGASLNLSDMINGQVQQQQGNNTNSNNPQDPGLQNYLTRLQQQRQQGDELDKLLNQHNQHNQHNNHGQTGSSPDLNNPPDLNNEYYKKLNDITHRFNQQNGNQNNNNQANYNNINNVYNQNGLTMEMGQKTAYISLDFREDLRDIENNLYSLKFGNIKNLAKIELVSCMLTRNQLLESEPYIYLNIEEIPGNYTLSSGKRVFGKLFQDKKIGNFIEYRPEKCVKLFDHNNPVLNNLNCLTLGFLRFNHSRIGLHNLDIKRVIKQLSTNTLKIITISPHYMSTGDLVNISVNRANHISVKTLPVLDIIDNNTFTILDNMTISNNNPVLTLERAQIKSSLTFKIE